jgi:hypothetical protein|tara:strand:+ start:916 stop:2160 length:1245 start_codon:yes stop_codon:yes gene_type:complete
MTHRFNIKQWFLISLLLRIIVMPFTMHGDLIFIYKSPHLMSHGEWDVYGILAEKNSVYYPPFSLIFFATVQLIFRLFFPGFEQFTHSLGLLGKKALYGSEHLYLSLFLMKLPYLVFDCLIILTCWKMLSNNKSKLLFMVFWAINPVVIYGPYMFGQFDLIASFFVVLACYFSLKEGKGHFATLSLAAGCLFKIYPIAFLPLVLCISSKNFKDFVRLLIYGAFPVLFFYGFFYSISGEAVLGVFKTQSHNIEIIDSLGVVVLRFFQGIVYALVCCHIFMIGRSKLDYPLLSQYFVIIYFAIYWGLSVSSTHRYLFLIPFLIYFVHNRPEWKKPFYFLLAVIFLGGLRGRASFLGIFAPINPEFFLSFPSVKDISCYLFNCSIYTESITLLFKGTTAIMTIILLKNLFQPLYKRTS